LPEREYTAAEVDAAVAALADPGRVRHAQEVVAHLAPQLQRILNTALDEGGYFGNAHEAELRRAAAAGDPEARAAALRTLVAEETRLGMLVGVAVGFELARELEAGRSAAGPGRSDVARPDHDAAPDAREANQSEE
jgi:hypothetical protein